MKPEDITMAKVKPEDITLANVTIECYDKLTDFIARLESKDPEPVVIEFHPFSIDGTVKIDLPYEEALVLLHRQERRLETILRSIGLEQI
jgi:hypothetical protein